MLVLFDNQALMAFFPGLGSCRMTPKPTHARPKRANSCRPKPLRGRQPSALHQRRSIEVSAIMTRMCICRGVFGASSAPLH